MRKYCTGVISAGYNFLQQGPFLRQQDKIRDHVIVENRHEPTTIHLKTCVTDRYKITAYYNREYGELFDLQEDPSGVNNQWNDQSAAKLKEHLTQKLLFAEMGKEPVPMPRIAGA